MTIRPSGRKPEQARLITIETGVNAHAEGSALISYGNTKVLCTASVDEKNLPRFIKNSGRGWVTAEYGMLPRSTHTRSDREAAKGKQTGRTQEIQRLIGRSLRSVVDFKKMGERQIVIDCDVLQADGGTRTASITGGFVAMYQALKTLVDNRILKEIPVSDQVAAISCGIFEGITVADLDYVEDSRAKADVNFVLTSKGRIVEIQGTAEESPFTEEEFLNLLALSKQSMQEIFRIQREALGL